MVKEESKSYYSDCYPCSICENSVEIEGKKLIKIHDKVYVLCEKCRNVFEWVVNDILDSRKKK